MNDEQILEDLVRISRRTADLGYVVAGGGNTSARAECESEFWIKRSGCPLEGVTSRDFIRMNVEEAAVDPQHPECALRNRADERFRASIEAPMHAIMYNGLPDVNFIVHTHAPCTLAACCTGNPIGFLRPQFPDAVVYLGDPSRNWILLGYKPPGPPIAEDLRESLRGFTGELRAVLLSNHGAITLGASASEAMARTEVLEKAAYVRLMSSVAKEVTFLERAEVDVLENTEAEKYRQRVMKGKI